MEMSRKAIPYTPNEKKLNEMKIGIVSTAGAHLKDQEAFSEDQTTGDLTYRIIPGDVDSADFSVTHAAPKDDYDTEEPKKDINTIFPIDRLRELEAEGYIGGLADNHFSMMGFAMRLNRLLKETVPEVVKKVVRSKADGVILTAGWPLCHRTVVTVQRAIESQGIPTVLVTLDPEQSGLMRPPRAIHPKGFQFGHSLGKPGDRETQTLVLKAALEELTKHQEPGQIHELDFPSYK